LKETLGKYRDAQRERERGRERTKKERDRERIKIGYKCLDCQVSVSGTERYLVDEGRREREKGRQIMIAKVGKESEREREREKERD
jgi:hypothetical protein